MNQMKITRIRAFRCRAHLGCRSERDASDDFGSRILFGLPEYCEHLIQLLERQESLITPFEGEFAVSHPICLSDELLCFGSWHVVPTLSLFSHSVT
jgi:hypothetical protein